MLITLDFALYSCLKNPESFLSKRDLFKSGQPDNMEKNLIPPGVSVSSESNSSPFPSPTPDESYQAVA